MILQIIRDAELANWVIAIILVILGFLLVRILNRVETKLENHEVRISEAEVDIAVAKRGEQSTDKILSEILLKIETIKEM